MTLLPKDDMELDLQIAKKLREETALPVLECRRLAIEANNDLEKALKMARAEYYKNRPKWTYIDSPTKL